MERVLERESGVLALSGTPDMRDVLRRSDEGDERAGLAVEVYVHRLCGSIAAMAASMAGVDAVAFTGGVGEGSAGIRAAACQGLRFMGLSLDAARNEEAGDEDVDLSAPGAAVRVTVVQAREDLEIAREVRRIGSSRRH
jgi:acetate kinase